MKRTSRRVTPPLLNGTQYVCRSEGNGFVVLNKRGHWTPVLEFGHPFEANLAVHLARWRSGYTRDSISSVIAAPTLEALQLER